MLIRLNIQRPDEPADNDYEEFDKRKGYLCITFSINDTVKKSVNFLDRDYFRLLMTCDGAHDIDIESLGEYQKEFMNDFLKEEIIRPAGFLDFLAPVQEYKMYPAEYKESVHWSITGACNLKCRHCFMSAPHAKHGAPTHEQIIKIADSLAECGIYKVGLTGGEPLIRDDFLDIVSALSDREITIITIHTNGWLIDEKLLDELEKRGQHPSFQLSYDGVGMHDFLRGVEGAEGKTLKAFKLLKERGYSISASMCVHKKNMGVLRESVKLLASLGVSSVKAGSMMELGEWAQPEVADLQLSQQENLEMIEKYIPQYFEDDAPLSIMLPGAFMYTPGDEEWHIKSTEDFYCLGAFSSEDVIRLWYCYQPPAGQCAERRFSSIFAPNSSISEDTCTCRCSPDYSGSGIGSDACRDCPISVLFCPQKRPVNRVVSQLRTISRISIPPSIRERFFPVNRERTTALFRGSGIYSAENTNKTDGNGRPRCRCFIYCKM